ncbi:MAG: hypothetical protein AAFW46_12565 [Pseudomonadota bacterium]
MALHDEILTGSTEIGATLRSAQASGGWDDSVRAWLLSNTPGFLENWVQSAPPMLALLIVAMGVLLAGGFIIGVVSVLLRLGALASLERAAELSAKGGGGAGGRSSGVSIELARARRLAAEGDGIGAKISAETAYSIAGTEADRTAALTEIAMAHAVSGEAAEAERRAAEALSLAQALAARTHETGLGGAEDARAIQPEIRAARLRALSLVEERLGAARSALGDPEGASALLSAAAASDDQAEGLEPGTPETAARRIRLSLARAAAAAAAGGAEPDPTALRAEALAGAEALLALGGASPLRSDSAAAAAEAFEAGAAAAWAAEDPAAGRARQERALEIRRSIAAATPGDRAAVRRLVSALSRMADWFPGEGHAREALEKARAAALGPTVTGPLEGAAAADGAAS